MADLTSAHEFQLNSMKLKLEAAQVRIREMADFALKKKAIEDENAAYAHFPHLSIHCILSSSVDSNLDHSEFHQTLVLEIERVSLLMHGM